MGMDEIEYFNGCLAMVEGNCNPKRTPVVPHPSRPECIEEVLIDWAENYKEQSVEKVMADLEFLYREYFEEIARKEWAAGQN